ncbi:hypothetical protein BpHYR1_053704 [Brachionus plicatilis]|uniref:Uncharacterized protein n=1 Tax=Brachionus plicatilis TaxID=10195 RepID=A0A3M7PZ84_BRAPC|nr:hypothetical protein BpHYR1_053704 [Brachionus plicatilis]
MALVFVATEIYHYPSLLQVDLDQEIYDLLSSMTRASYKLTCRMKKKTRVSKCDKKKKSNTYRDIRMKIETLRYLILITIGIPFVTSPLVICDIKIFAFYNQVYSVHELINYFSSFYKTFFSPKKNFFEIRPVCYLFSIICVGAFHILKSFELCGEVINCVKKQFICGD